MSEREDFGEAVRELGRAIWDAIEKALKPVVRWLSDRLSRTNQGDTDASSG